MISGPVRLGVVGLGRIARAYVDAIQALPEEHAALTAVAARKSKPPVELSEESKEVKQATKGLDWPEARRISAFGRGFWKEH